MSFFKKAILLTTKADEHYIKDKCAHIEAHLGLPAGFVEVFVSEADTEDPKRGCFNAHFNAYCYIAEHQLDNCLIFEDDVFFLSKVPASLYEGFLKKGNWDVFYFGHKPDFRQDTYVRRTKDKNILQVRTNDRHAYAMSYRFAKEMAEKPWSGIFGDRLLRSSTDKAYALVPGMAIQTGRLFTASHLNGITEKFSEYIRMANQTPFRIADFIKYLLLIVFKMPYWVVFCTILALRVTPRDQ